MRGVKTKVLFLVFFFLLGHCVNLPRSFHALHYKNQKVYIDKNHYYQVGPLSQAWRKTADKNPGIIFKHAQWKATLATEAICGADFEDLPLKMLTNHLLTGLENFQNTKEEDWLLSGRKALYTATQASLDGVAVWLNIVVAKKNRCQFDFMSVAPPEAAQPVTRDFLQFVKGFKY
ncbi:MAG: hypothetical protein HY466_02445 [Deltaproteobacteria bacterium]|nr:hypothetical protein [Deltaproteobacteria bacterium]